MARRAKRSETLRQESLPFLTRTRRLDRAFKRGIATATVLVIVAVFAGTSVGRYAASLAAVRARGAVSRAFAPESSRAEHDAEWRLRRERGIVQTRAVYRDFYDHEASPALRRILAASGMAPDEVLLRWANYDWTVVLSPMVFQADDTGRAYRLKPKTRAGWVWDTSLPRGLNCFFFIPDTPEVRRAVADAGLQFIPESFQTTNSWGLRGPEPDLTAPVRGLVIGDSFMQGIFVRDDETPPVRLEQSLAATLGKRVTVVNTGHIGYSLEQYYYTFLEYFGRVRPHFVVVSICPNDFGDANAVMFGTGGGGDWVEGKYWLGQIEQYCRSRQVPCVVIPVPFESQVAGPRKDGHYPGQVSNIVDGSGPFFLNPIEDFINENLRLVTEGTRRGARPPTSPLFNGHLHDAHFSALGSALWGKVVGRRIALLLDARDASHESAGRPGY